MNTIEYGPFEEETMLSAGLDYYKPTMSQLEHQKHPEAEVTFTFKNRSDRSLADYVNPADLQARLDFIRERGWSGTELEYLGDLTNAQGEAMFAPTFIDYLRNNPLPPVSVRYDEALSDLAIDTTGDWDLVTFWETVVMSEANEAYFEGLVEACDLDLEELYEEGDRRLSEKIAFLQEHPDLKVAEFGTRRRFSMRWQRHVAERLKNECPDNFVGTSNVALSRKFGTKPVGTFAHELPMVYAGIADANNQDIRASHGEMLDDWYDMYGDELAVALSDTFGTDFFFDDFGVKRAENFSGTRWDSGDAYEYGEKAINYYQQQNIDPQTKSIAFTDSLDVYRSNDILEVFKGRLGKILFGIGTDFTNDMGLLACNVVMKATHVKLPNGQEAELVKLSDDAGKHTGGEQKVKQYQEIFSGTLITA
jgi:nicotinate phosphoribosyltransferase